MEPEENYVILFLVGYFTAVVIFISIIEPITMDNHQEKANLCFENNMYVSEDFYNCFSYKDNQKEICQIDYEDGEYYLGKCYNKKTKGDCCRD